MVAWRDWLLSKERADRAVLTSMHSEGALSLSRFIKPRVEEERTDKCDSVFISAAEISKSEPKKKKDFVDISAAIDFHGLVLMDGQNEGEPALRVWSCVCVTATMVCFASVVQSFCSDTAE